MKLARKLTLAILAVMIAVLSINTVERIARDRTTFRQDTRRDHRALGHALSVVVRESFREDGEQRALSLVSAANERKSGVNITWWWLPAEAASSGLDQAAVETLLGGEETELLTELDGAPYLASYFPVRVADGRTGAISIAESLRAEQEAVRITIVRSLLSSVMIALCSACGSWGDRSSV